MLIYSLNKYVLNFTTNYCHIIAALGNTRMTNHICPPGSDNALEKKKKKHFTCKRSSKFSSAGQ